VPDHHSAYGEFLSRVGAREVPSLVLPEEHAPDLSVASSSRQADLICSVELPSPSSSGFPSSDCNFRFFIDGVQRTIMLRIIDLHIPGLGDVQVPVHGVHLIAGALERVGTTLRPYLVRSTQLLLLPLSALREVDSTRFGETPGAELDPDIVNYIYPELIREIPKYSDTAIPLERGRRGSRVSPDNLIRVGELRSRALNRAKVLLRILELGLISEVRTSCEDYILVDGPLGPVFKYYGSLIDETVDNVRSFNRDNQTAELSFNFLRKIVGAVKNVQIIPSGGLSYAIDQEQYRIPVYRFSDVLASSESTGVDDDVYKAVLCAFVWLRPEIPGHWSPIAGLTRLDIPSPVIIQDTERRNWVERFVNQDAVPALSQSNRDELRRVVVCYLNHRWPLPGAFGARMYTELFAIAEAERWLRGQLLHPYELRRRLTG
jgi:hypothetical protein